MKHGPDLDGQITPTSRTSRGKCGGGSELAVIFVRTSEGDLLTSTSAQDAADGEGGQAGILESKALRKVQSF